jgi:hypothetical protein
MKIKLLKDKHYKFGLHLANGEVRDAVWNKDANCYQIISSEGIILSLRKSDVKVIDHTFIIGKQYGSHWSAVRAIHNFKVQNLATIPPGFRFWVNQIDEGCHEIEGGKL